MMYLCFDDPLMWPILTLLCLLAYFGSCLFVCCPFPCVFVVFQCPVCVFMVFCFFSAVLLSKMEWWRSLYHCYIFKNVVPFRCTLLNVHLPVLCILLYFCGEFRSQGAEKTDSNLSAVCVLSDEQLMAFHCP